ncbi:MAG: amidohydrolase family protein, partial [Synergistaceae bacterium]|nr:amidohydrolase family protein [Synergistaceae bacterium]
FDLPTAIQKMTPRPASIFKMKNRGLIKEGYAADLVIFDPEKVIDRATYENPKQFATGIPHVIVGGKTAIEEGSVRHGKSGRVVRFKE